jgi:hypothetical protein
MKARGSFIPTVVTGLGEEEHELAQKAVARAREELGEEGRAGEPLLVSILSGADRDLGRGVLLIEEYLRGQSGGTNGALGPMAAWGWRCMAVGNATGQLLSSTSELLEMLSRVSRAPGAAPPELYLFLNKDQADARELTDAIETFRGKVSIYPLLFAGQDTQGRPLGSDAVEQAVAEILELLLLADPATDARFPGLSLRAHGGQMAVAGANVLELGQPLLSQVRAIAADRVLPRACGLWLEEDPERYTSLQEVSTKLADDYVLQLVKELEPEAPATTDMRDVSPSALRFFTSPLAKRSDFERLQQESGPNLSGFEHRLRETAARGSKRLRESLGAVGTRTVELVNDVVVALQARGEPASWSPYEILETLKLLTDPRTKRLEEARQRWSHQIATGLGGGRGADSEDWAPWRNIEQPAVEPVTAPNWWAVFGLLALAAAFVVGHYAQDPPIWIGSWPPLLVIAALVAIGTGIWVGQCFLLFNAAKRDFLELYSASQLQFKRFYEVNLHKQRTEFVKEIISVLEKELVARASRLEARLGTLRESVVSKERAPAPAGPARDIAKSLRFLSDSGDAKPERVDQVVRGLRINLTPELLVDWTTESPKEPPEQWFEMVATRLLDETALSDIGNAIRSSDELRREIESRLNKLQGNEPPIPWRQTRSRRVALYGPAGHERLLEELADQFRGLPVAPEIATHKGRSRLGIVAWQEETIAPGLADSAGNDGGGDRDEEGR